MALRVQMAGTGSAFAKKYYNNNALIYADGFTLMIDFGITAPAALHAMGKPLDEIDAVLVSHLHADHIGGLEEFAFRMKMQYGKKPVMVIADTLIEPLWEHSLKAGLDSPAEGMTKLKDYFDLVILQERTPHALHPNLRVEIIKTKHMPNMSSYSLIINDDELFYSADVVFDRPLLDYVHEERGCKHILHDCQLQPPGVVHATLDQLLSLPEPMQEKIRLMHYGDDMEQFIGRTGRMTFLEQHRMYDLT